MNIEHEKTITIQTAFNTQITIQVTEGNKEYLTTTEIENNAQKITEILYWYSAEPIFKAIKKQIRKQKTKEIF